MIFWKIIRCIAEVAHAHSVSSLRGIGMLHQVTFPILFGLAMVVGEEPKTSRRRKGREK